MSFDFNKKGQTYGFEAHAGDKSDFGVLREKAFCHFSELQSMISSKHQHGDEKIQKLMVGAQGCYERFEAFLVQSQRLANHSISVLKQKAPEPGSMVAFRDTLAVYDFEALLFNSRALLDRISFFIAKQIYNQDCDKPNKLKNVLENFIQKDSKARQAIEIIDEAMPVFIGLVIDSENGQKSLRSHLIHKSTSGENTTCAFTIHSAPNDQVIRFDHEINGFPLIGSAWLISKYIIYFSINLLGIYLEIDFVLPIDECTPRWDNNLKCFSRFIDETNIGPPFSMIKMNPSGVNIFKRHLRPEVLK